MKPHRIFYLLFVVLYASCSHHPALNVPDSVDRNTDNADIQIPGTQFFMAMPPNFIIDSANSSLILDTVSHLGVPSAAKAFAGDSITKISFTEYAPADFTTNFNLLRHAMDSLLGHKLGIYYNKTFQLEGYKAIIYYYPDRRKGSDWITLFFGDESFFGKVEARFPSDNVQRRDQIVESLLTLYRKPEIQINEAGFMPFTIDLSHTDFSFFRKIDRSYLFTPKGKAESGLTFSDVIELTRLTLDTPKSISQLAFTKAEHIRSRDKGRFTFSDPVYQRSKVGKDSVVEFVMRDKYQDLNGCFYVRMQGDSIHPLEMIVCLLHDTDRCLKEVQTAANALTLKDQH